MGEGDNDPESAALPVTPSRRQGNAVSWPRDEIGAHIGENGKFISIPVHNLPIQIDTERSFLVLDVAEHSSVGINDPAVAGVIPIRIPTTSIDPGYERLVLDCTDLEKCSPMVSSNLRPARNNHHQIDTMTNLGPEHLGESQVVTDKRRDDDAVFLGNSDTPALPPRGAAYNT